MIGILPIAYFLTLISPDAEPEDGTDVQDVLAKKRESNGYPALVEAIRRDGITVPVLVVTDDGSPYLGDGHHRIAAAIDVGLETVPWTNVPLDICY